MGEMKELRYNRMPTSHFGGGDQEDPQFSKESPFLSASLLGCSWAGLLPGLALLR